MQSKRQNRTEKYELYDKKRKMVSKGTDPSQSFEGAAEIRKAGVTFPVELRIFFGVRIGLQRFK